MRCELARAGGTFLHRSMTRLALGRRRYGLSKAYVDALVLPAPVKPAHATATLERQAQAGGHRAKGKGKARPKLKLSVMAAPVEALSGSQRLALLRALYLRLQQLLGRGEQAPAAPAPAPDAAAAPAAAASKVRRRCIQLRVWLREWVTDTAACLPFVACSPACGQEACARPCQGRRHGRARQEARACRPASRPQLCSVPPTCALLSSRPLLTRAATAQPATRQGGARRWRRRLGHRQAGCHGL